MLLSLIFALFLGQSVTCFQKGELVKKSIFYGQNVNLKFEPEDHKVITEDKYILSLKRLKNDGPPILIMHGLFGSSADFTAFGNDRSLPNSLSEQGYDIWLGNNRGNTFSHAHHDWDVNSQQFWNFSFHEMGYYDCPALIDYILNETNQTSLTLIGHAQGATQMLVMASARPEYSNKVDQIIAFAPFVYMSRIPHPILQLLKPMYSLVEVLLGRYHIEEFLAHNDNTAYLLKLACQSAAISKFCSLVPYVLGGMKPEALEAESILQLLAVFPAGTSSKNIKHLLQQVNSGEFKRFDYGLMGNLNEYNQIKPPIYNLSAISIPVNIFYSKNDWLASETDIAKLEKELPNGGAKCVPLKYFNHYDYVMAKDVKSLLHYDVINLVNDHHNKSEITSTTSHTSINTPSTKEQPSPPTSSTTPTAPTTQPTSDNPNSTTHHPSSTHKPGSATTSTYSLLMFVLCFGFLILK